jgi:hypothetical protein
MKKNDQPADHVTQEDISNIMLVLLEFKNLLDDEQDQLCKLKSKITGNLHVEKHQIAVGKFNLL